MKHFAKGVAMSTSERGEISPPVVVGHVALEMSKSRSMREIRVATEEIAQANPDNIQEVAASLLQLTSSYYVSARQQSQRSFVFALIAAAIGLCFLITAFWFTDKMYLSLGSGALMELLSTVIFTLYGRTTNQLAEFHRAMERMQRFIIAYSMTEGLEGETKQQARADLVKTVSTVGMELLMQRETLKKQA
jgi:hypothetical protein